MIMGLTLIIPSALPFLKSSLHVCVYFEKESEGEYSLYLNQEQKLVGSSSYYILGRNWGT